MSFKGAKRNLLTRTSIVVLLKFLSFFPRLNIQVNAFFHPFWERKIILPPFSGLSREKG